MNPLLLLLIAIASEVTATTALKLSEGFTKPLPIVFVVAGYASAFYCFSLALKSIPLGPAYAIWSALGTIGAVAVGTLIWRSPINWQMAVGVALIIAGVVLLNLYAGEARA